MVPKRSGTPPAGATPIPNLVRRSVRDNGLTGTNPMPSPGFPSRASAVNSVADVSANGRSITFARWNKHYLSPRRPPNPLNETWNTVYTDPVSSFVAPDWVMLTAEEGAAV